ncbi:hypothetical protein CO695_08440 [Providencia alcalifaciens]|uniref:Uncharacterized protein n=1 Tax=Providencia alcalifaciens DSM 30120 TaxID=520999 RepID=B6XBG0_9GAMM|nr:hypothetical protein [Providencia alcalifaciens]ATG16319.1 hypothetical protein CO695_08440 [Providencia alcalifaciens]EEB47255.1 hypothetical protein PROVALCAL_00669 [Providencia alcalifaciens DSM 30120]
MKGTTLTELIKSYTDQGFADASRFMNNKPYYYESSNAEMFAEVYLFRRKHFPKGKAFLRIVLIENGAKHIRSQREASNAGN